MSLERHLNLSILAFFWKCLFLQFGDKVAFLISQSPPDLLYTLLVDISEERLLGLHWFLCPDPKDCITQGKAMALSSIFCRLLSPQAVIAGNPWLSPGPVK